MTRYAQVYFKKIQAQIKKKTTSKVIFCTERATVHNCAELENGTHFLVKNYTI